MKKVPFWVGLLAICLTTPLPLHAGKLTKKKEWQFRVSHQFGVIGREEQATLHAAFKRFIIIAPEANLSVQFSRRWFFSVTSGYERLRGRRSSGNGNILHATAGVKIVSNTIDPTYEDFFDDTRWWLGLEFGPYYTDVNSRIIGNDSGTSFGFNVGAGFDYFINKWFGAGFQTKFHYVNYRLDDYMLLTFGPHGIIRF